MLLFLIFLGLIGVGAMSYTAYATRRGPGARVNTHQDDLQITAERAAKAYNYTLTASEEAEEARVVAQREAWEKRHEELCAEEATRKATAQRWWDALDETPL